MIAQTSMLAYIDVMPSIGAKQKRVYDYIKLIGPSTNLEVSRNTGMPINTVTPRTNELVKIGMLKQCGKRKCLVSGRIAKTWSV